MGKVALVHDFILTYAGAERVLSALTEIYPDAPIYTLIADRNICKEYFPNTKIITSRLNKSIFRRKPAWLIGSMPRAIEEFNFNGYNLVISSSGAFAHGIITGPDTTHICYCHSPMRYVWDWHTEYLKEKGITSPLKRVFAELALSKLRIWDRVAAQRVDYWLANSENVRNRIHKYYNANSQVIYPPVDIPEFAPPTSNRESYFVTVSRLTTNKRIDLIIQACASLKLPLKIIGDGADLARLRQISKEVGGAGQFTGKLPNSQKMAVLNGAQAFIFAAEDDFGIAPVEALGCGVPVIAFGKGGALETVRDGRSGLFFREPTVKSLTETLQVFLEKGVDYSSEEIWKSAKPFRKERFIQEIKEFIDHV